MTGAFAAQKENAEKLFSSIVIPAYIFCTVRLRNFYKYNICLWLTVLVAGYPDEQKRELGSTLFFVGAERRNLYEHRGKEEADREASPTCFSNCST